MGRPALEVKYEYDLREESASDRYLTVLYDEVRELLKG